MEIYEAKYNYDKQRKDVLSFRKGDQFYIIDKPNSEWWKARKIDADSHNFGYVPSVYLEKAERRTVGKLIPEGRRNTREHDIHLQALAELHQRVKPLPEHVIGQALGVNVSKDTAPKPKGLIEAKRLQQNQKGKDLSDLRGKPNLNIRVTSPEPSPLETSQRLQANNNRFDRSPSPRPKSRDGSFRLEDEFPPYHPISPPPIISSPPPPDYDLPLPSPPPPDYDLTSPPPPDYDDDDDEDNGDASNQVPYHHRLNNSGRYIDLSLSDGILEDEPPTMAPTTPPHGHLPSGRFDEEGLVQPKPLANPVKDSPVHKSLHRELRTSGRSVLNSQSELEKAFRSRTERASKKAMEDEQKSRRTSFDIKLGERLKLAEKEQESESLKNLEVLEKAAREPEFMKVQLRSRPGSNKT